MILNKIDKIFFLQSDPFEMIIFKSVIFPSVGSLNFILHNLFVLETNLLNKQILIEWYCFGILCKRLPTHITYPVDFLLSPEREIVLTLISTLLYATMKSTAPCYVKYFNCDPD